MRWIPIFLLAALPADAAVFRVTKTADTLDGACDHDCSLREAVAAANLAAGPDTVVLDPGVYVLSRTGVDEDGSATGDLDVTGDLMIAGAGADRTVLDGGGTDRVLDVRLAGSLQLHGVTVRNGRAFQGGGIRADGPLAVTSCLITGNVAAEQGGGIFDTGRLTVRDSTISGNEARVGGGLYDWRSDQWTVDNPHPAPKVRLSNVTVSGNRAGFLGGGITVDHVDTEIEHLTVTGNHARFLGGFVRNECACVPEEPGCCGPSHFELSRSILAGNTAGSDAPDCSMVQGSSGGFNVFGIGDSCYPVPTDKTGTAASPLDPRITPLGDYGGPTPTHHPLPDSPALHITGEDCAPTDQRGVARPSGPGCDAGAVEAAPGCLPGSERLCLQHGRFAVTAHWTAQGNGGPGKTVPLASDIADSGAFWFFDPNNLELTVKVLDGCGVNGRYWVFLSGLTDVAVQVRVEDTRTGEVWTHANPAGAPFRPRLDTDALEVCP